MVTEKNLMIATIFAQASIAPVEEKIGLFQMMQRGGPLMVVLFVCSVVALGVFFERLFYYKRSRMNVSEFLAGVLALVRRQSYAEAITRCEEGHGPIVSVVRTAIYKRHLPPAELREVVREIAQLEIPNLEANISLLGTIGYVAPLLGLLGTVLGMIDAFVQINRTSGTASVGELSQGIYLALITTAAGLVGGDSLLPRAQFSRRAGARHRRRHGTRGHRDDPHADRSAAQGHDRGAVYSGERQGRRAV